LRELWNVAIWSTPVFFLLQLVALALLLWRVIYRRVPAVPARGWVLLWLLRLGVVVAPVVMLFVSVVFVGDYQEQYGHWFFHMHDGTAGLVLLPFYVAASAVVAIGLSRRDLRLRRGTHLMVLIILIVICAWSSYATAALGMLTNALVDLSMTALVPAVAAANYALVAIDLNRRGPGQPARTAVVAAWLSALAVTIAVKVPLAMRFYAALPPERPQGYGDCFVVSAAALGHPRFVGSWYDARLGRTVNDQWRTLRAFEDRLAQRLPASHARLRRFYNRAGPAVAARIRSPLSADLMYLALKPVEWLARGCLFLRI